MVLVKHYRIVRMPEEIYQKYFGVKLRMESDIRRVTGKQYLKLSMPKVFNAIIDPKLNENFIEVDLLRLSKLSQRKKGKYDLL
jgi:hypothetical protein